MTHLGRSLGRPVVARLQQARGFTAMPLLVLTALAIATDEKDLFFVLFFLSFSKEDRPN
jgi:hypothetical protein